MIVSYKDKDTEKLANHIRVAKYRSIERIALRKLVQLEVAYALNDLRIPPGNRLESLSGDRTGHYSIRINDKYRICFKWASGKAYEVEITDYHD
ncbi:MAG: type II toxin-antitoxin system RelE/ParE family toxin [Clostridiales Family XIII bacterium]|jgi:proteic killer suppression protein|nr:type II toxin-antitoxin system RelE/ParE family toxin [Clostridiales Family XIII bacterium]